jgi:hypothetical protein
MMLGVQDIHPQAKQMKMCKSGNMILKTDVSLHMTWIMRWGSHLDHARAFRHDVNMQWTAMPGEQKQNCISVCQETFRKNVRETSILCVTFLSSKTQYHN